MFVEGLAEVVTSPVDGNSRTYDWAAVEAELGCGLPGDYKELIEAYGPGCFGGFLYIYQPNSPWEELDLREQSAAELEALRELQEDGEEVPYRLDEPAELLSFGRSDNGDALFWNRSGEAGPDGWTVVVKEARGEEWFAFDGGVVEFLRAVLGRDLRVSVFPDDFPGREAGFEPYETG